MFSKHYCLIKLLLWYNLILLALCPKDLPHLLLPLMSPVVHKGVGKPQYERVFHSFPLPSHVSGGLLSLATTETKAVRVPVPSIMRATDVVLVQQAQL